MVEIINGHRHASTDTDPSEQFSQDLRDKLQDDSKVLAKKIPLMEMFGPTVQGEGAMIGQQTYFFRFGLCDYKCRMCDSMHAVDPKSVAEHAEWLTQEAIFQKWLEFYKPNTTRWITFSGGNPAIHNMTHLVDRLRKQGFMINVETQGTKFPDWLNQVDYITVSPKGPGMGEKFEPEVFQNFIRGIIARKMYPYRVCIKIVAFDQRDLEFASMVFEMLSEAFDTDQFYLSLGNPYPPGTGEGDYMSDADLSAELVSKYKVLLEDIQTHPVLSQVKFLPQYHVLLWGNKKEV